MDPFTMMMIAGGVSGAVSGGLGLAGGMMNTSSQQAINAANLQQAQWSAEGGYLPGLVKNAGKAGLSPLAVLGMRGPDMAVQTGTTPGAGLQAAAKAVPDLTAAVLAEKQIQKTDIDIANARQAGNNMAIQGARDSWVLSTMQDYMRTHPTAIPPGGITEASLSGSGVDWLHHFFNDPWSSPQATPIGGMFRGSPAFDPGYYTPRIPY